MYEINYKGAVDDLARIRAYDRQIIIRAIRRHLMEGNPIALDGDVKKRIVDDDGTSILQLKAGGDWRVFYDVDEEDCIVYVRHVRHKGRKTTGEIR